MNLISFSCFEHKTFVDHCMQHKYLQSPIKKFRKPLQKKKKTGKTLRSLSFFLAYKIFPKILLKHLISFKNNLNPQKVKPFFSRILIRNFHNRYKTLYIAFTKKYFLLLRTLWHCFTGRNGFTDFKKGTKHIRRFRNMMNFFLNISCTFLSDSLHFFSKSEYLNLFFYSTEQTWTEQ